MRSDVRMLASRWKLRVVAKMAGATFMWFVDTCLAVWASILFLMQCVGSGAWAWTAARVAARMALTPFPHVAARAVATKRLPSLV